LNLKKIKCGPNQHCVAREKDHECLCNPGYEKSLSYETLGCSNIDECLSRTHTCVGNSFCIDTEGSFECECEPGFEVNDNPVIPKLRLVFHCIGKRKSLVFHIIVYLTRTVTRLHFFLW